MPKPQPKSLEPEPISPKQWKSPSGDYCYVCNTTGPRDAEQVGNSEVRTCKGCNHRQYYMTK